MSKHPLDKYSFIKALKIREAEWERCITEYNLDVPKLKHVTDFDALYKEYLEDFTDGAWTFLSGMSDNADDRCFYGKSRIRLERGRDRT